MNGSANQNHAKNVLLYKVYLSMKTLTISSFTMLFVMSSQFSTSQTLTSKQDEKTGLYGFVDQDDKYVVKPTYKEVDYNFGYGTGLSKVVNASGKVGFVNELGKEVVKCKYDEAGTFERGYTVARIKAGEYDYKHALLDSTGKEIIPLSYGRMEYYPNDQVLVTGETNTSAVGITNLEGKVLISAQYEFWSKRISKGLWPVGKNNICGVVNLKNEIIVPFVYEMIESYSDELNVALAKKEGKHGFIDRSGKVIIPFMYNDGWASGTSLVVKKEGKWGAIGIDQKVILPFEYANISSIGDKTAWVSKNENEDSYEIDLVTRQKVK